MPPKFDWLSPTLWRIVFGLLSSDILQTFAEDLRLPRPASELQDLLRPIIERNREAYVKENDPYYPERIQLLFEDVTESLSTAWPVGSVDELFAWIRTTFDDLKGENLYWGAYLSAFLKWRADFNRYGTDRFALGDALPEVVRSYDYHWKPRSKELKRRIEDIELAPLSDWDSAIFDQLGIGLVSGKSDLHLFPYIIGPAHANYMRDLAEHIRPLLSAAVEERIREEAVERLPKRLGRELPLLSELPFPSWWRESMNRDVKG